jgi:hypothetical protein
VHSPRVKKTKTSTRKVNMAFHPSNNTTYANGTPKKVTYTNDEKNNYLTKRTPC